MNKFFIALLVTIFGFSFSNKSFAKSIIVEKKKNNIVDVVFILDRSGSMGGLESDTIGGQYRVNPKLSHSCRVTKLIPSSLINSFCCIKPNESLWGESIACDR